MTSESKENLLKILLNESTESPSTNIGTLIDDGTKTVSISSTSVLDQLSYNNYTIMVDYSNRLVLYDNEYNILFQDYLYINNTATYLWSIDVDSEGNLYGLTYYNSNLNLVYMNNITQKNVNGQYVLELKQNYNLEGMLTEIGNEVGTYVSRIGFHLKKSPTDSSFIIILDGYTDESVNKNLCVIQYNVNFGGTNDYQYRIKKVGDYDEMRIQSIYINWEESNFRINMFGINSAHNGYDYYTPGAVKFYWMWTDFREGITINEFLIYSDSSFLKTGALSSSVLMGSDRIWFIVAHKNASTQEVTTTVYLNYQNQVIPKYTIVGTTYAFSSMTYVNNQMFIGLIGKLDETHYKTALLQVQDTNVSILTEYENENYYFNLLFITNDFNLYNIFYNTHRYKYIYNPSEYNGTEYFSDKSVTSESTTLYGINIEGSRNIVPIFSRSLYNKTLTGNTITSTIQIPYNYLNNSVVTSERLISKSQNEIDVSNDEITKNQYEELYINNVDSFKVYDNNNGSTYNQNSSFELTKNIYNSFNTKYKLTHYRVNYKDNTHKDFKIRHITRTNNIAKIEISVNNTDIDTIQLYDSSFTCPFLTIDLSEYENGLYKITQYVKVE